MSFDLEQIRSRNPIEEIVAEKFPLKKSGTRFISVEHDSLVVIPNTGWYFWNSRNEQGMCSILSDGTSYRLAHGTTAARNSSLKPPTVLLAAQG